MYQILNLIGRVESGNNYNAVYGVNKTQNLTVSTIDQVIAWQKRYTAVLGMPSSAAGRYQIIRKTLKGLKEEMGLTGNELFDEKMQDRMAVTLLNRRGWQKFLNGDLSEKQMMINLAKEWASFPMPATMKIKGKQYYRGASYYSGDGLNKALVNVDEVLDTIKTDRAIHQIDNDIVVKVSWWDRLLNKVREFF